MASDSNALATQTTTGTHLDAQPDTARFQSLLRRAHDEPCEAVRSSHRVVPEPDFDQAQKERFRHEARLEGAKAIDEANAAVADLRKDEQRLEKRRDTRELQLDQQQVALGVRMDQQGQIVGRPEPIIAQWAPWLAGGALAAITTFTFHDAFIGPMLPLGMRILALLVSLAFSALIVWLFAVSPFETARHPVAGQSRGRALGGKIALAAGLGIALVLIRDQFTKTRGESALSFGLLLLEVVIMVCVELYCRHMSEAIEQHRHASEGHTVAGNLVQSQRDQLAVTERDLATVEGKLATIKADLRRRADLVRAVQRLEEAVVAQVEAGLRQGYETNRGLTYGGLTVPVSPAPVLDRLAPATRNGVVKNPE